MSELSSQLAAALPENNAVRPEWLKAIRESGAEQFLAHGLPTRKDEAWKYTGLGAIESNNLQMARASQARSSGELFPSPLIDSDVQLKLLDGQLHIPDGNQTTGLTVLSLAEALETGVTGLQALLESLSDKSAKGVAGLGFSALNSATLNSGVVIHVATGTDAGRLGLIHSTSKGDAPLMLNARICVILEQNSKLELFEQFESTDGSSNTSNIVLQAEVHESAVLRHIRFQQETENTALITRTEVKQHGNSEYAYYGFDLGGGLVRHDLHTSLSGSGAKSEINGAYLLDGNRHVDNHARVDHFAKNCVSDQYFRGVAGGSGRAVFNTAVCVHPGADGTEAKQSNANILLSRRAEIDTKPELEVYADEVIASHGATVGQLDELAVFYMRSRGLSEQEARQLLTTAFCQSVSDKLDDPELGEIISQRMMDVMPQAE